MTSHVVVNDTTPRATFTVGGTPSSGPFTLPSIFAVFDPSTDLKVYVDGTLIDYAASPADNTQWGWTGTLIDGGYNGGQIDLGGTVASVDVVVVRDIPIARTSDFPYPSSNLDIRGLNTQLDKVFAIQQDTALKLLRGLRQPAGDVDLIEELPGAAARASKYLGFDGDGQPAALSAPTDTALTTAFIETLLDDADAEAARTTLGVHGGTTDNALVRANGANGALQGSPATLSDAGALSLSGSFTLTNNGANALFVTGASTNSTGFRIRNTLGRDYVFFSSGAAGPIPGTGFGIYDNTAGAFRLGIGASGGLFTSGQSDQGAGTFNLAALYLAGRQVYPAHCWGKVSVSGGTPTLDDGANITGITDTGTGRLGVTIDVDHANDDYAAMPGIIYAASTSKQAAGVNSLAVGSFEVTCTQTDNGALVDPGGYTFATFGD